MTHDLLRLAMSASRNDFIHFSIIVGNPRLLGIVVHSWFHSLLFKCIRVLRVLLILLFVRNACYLISHFHVVTTLSKVLALFLDGYLWLAAVHRWSPKRTVLGSWQIGSLLVHWSELRAWLHLKPNIFILGFVSWHRRHQSWLFAAETCLWLFRCRSQLWA